MRLRPLLLAVLAPLLGACYTFQPVAGMPPAGVSLDVLLSDTGTLRLAGTVGPNAAAIRGEAVAVRGDTIDLAIREVRTRAGQSLFLRGTTVSLRRADLAEVRIRTLDRRRTTVAVGAGIAGAVALAAGVKLVGGGGGTDGGGGGTPAMRPPP